MTLDAVLITGASSGIGEACSYRLVEAGHRVLGGCRDADAAARLRAAGVEPIELDVTSATSIAGARAEVESRLGRGRLAGLVNNAGIVAAGAVELTPLEAFRAVMEVNYFGVVAVTQAFLPRLREARGRVVMMSSLAGLFATPYLAPYAASKFALEALADSLRREIGALGVSVTVIEPGPTATPIWKRVAGEDLTRYSGTVYEHPAARRLAAALAAGRNGMPARAVADAVFGVLTARRPPTRVIVANGRRSVRLARYLPDRLLDRLVRS